MTKAAFEMKLARWLSRLSQAVNAGRISEPRQRRFSAAVSAALDVRCSRSFVSEQLEHRTLLSANRDVGADASLNGDAAASVFPDALGYQDSLVSAAIRAITTTGSPASVFSDGETSESGDSSGDQLIESANLIRLDQFRNDARFIGIDGTGYSTVIDLNHSFFGLDSDFDGIADRIVYSYDFADNATNDVHVMANQVSDTLGDTDAAGVIASFEVNVQLPSIPGAFTVFGAVSGEQTGHSVSK